MEIRTAQPADVAALRQLIMTHGPNDWNYLPPDGVEQTLSGLASGTVQGLLAEEQGQLLAVMLFDRSDAYPAHRPADIAAGEAAFLIEAVVSRDAAGQGLGSRLLLKVCEILKQQGCRWLCADRHQQNAGSAGMMQKADLQELESFADPERRWSGSRMSTVCGRCL
ncbi:GNAT family N-acetyltransferase [Aquitalea sp. LB_tupeE]|uniref:GNAT family N-acetyltransferase n=1 Tax=Aquitalea sp. LB_tupeE TaxID=2748078 RepID=UPI0015BE2BE0|nr:GNAT family N-acetyltransferase [Aquitalea sp. LB_tupeE]NWK77759.1 GNAT family N-acetyltransferase [Aquitalea sp. LB_tupeE]